MKKFIYTYQFFFIFSLLFFLACNSDIQTKKSNIIVKDGMVFIEGGEFLMGGDNDEARSDEYPKHKVEVSSFWMDENEVTNAQFQKFINEIWGPYFDINEQNMQDSKTKLQELSQQKLKKLPVYSLIKKEGPSHSPIFTISLKVLNLKKIRASGLSIREAEKNAAKIALTLLNEK